MEGNGILKFSSEYDGYLRDESRMSGAAESISFPRSDGEVGDILKTAAGEDIPVTIQGGRTGITAGAVPDGGHILNLSLMNRITGLKYDEKSGAFFLAVQPGVLLSQLRAALFTKSFDTDGWTADSLSALKKLEESAPWFFPPDPTETSASIGGMAACNASGARSFYYGPTRKYIEALTLRTADGSRISLRRGVNCANGRRFYLPAESGPAFSGNLPGYAMPAVKNAAGFHAEDDMDMIDLFIGSEGTLGVITGLEIRLLPAPGCIWGAAIFLPSEEAALKFVRAIRGEAVEGISHRAPPKPAAIEFFNCDSLNLYRRSKAENLLSDGLPGLNPQFHTGVYIEYHGETEDTVCGRIMRAMEILNECGGSEESTWVADGSRELQRLQSFRHAIPELVNTAVDRLRVLHPELTKLGTDMAVPDSRLQELMRIYNTDLEKRRLESVIFGHIGANHLHANILPRNRDEYEKGKKLYLDWAETVISMGGTVSAEHGIGKLKTELLSAMYGDRGVNEMRALKKIFDPRSVLNRGNLFET